MQNTAFPVTFPEVAISLIHYLELSRCGFMQTNLQAKTPLLLPLPGHVGSIMPPKDNLAQFRATNRECKRKP